MTAPQTFAQQQWERWNGVDGEHWKQEHERLERFLSPITGPLLTFAAPAAGSSVIDAGCGCGETTVALARAVGASGHVIGLDLSEPMLGVAKRRLQEFANAECILGDAATARVEGKRADLLFSRFGVMFFADPVAAFANLRKGLKRGGRVRFACWRTLKENAWQKVPLDAIFEHVPRPPKPEPEEPGPFSFGKPERVTRILTAAGFAKPSFTLLDVELDLAGGGGLDDAVQHLSQLGSVRRTMADQPEEARAAAIGALRKALAPYVSAGGVKLPAAVWLVATEAVNDPL